jgi:hypothetical protein
VSKLLDTSVHSLFGYDSAIMPWHDRCLFIGLKKKAGKQMYRAILIWTASFIFSSLIAGKTSFASEVNSPVGTKTSISPSSESGQERRALQQLTVALAAGGGSWSSFHRVKVDNEETKHPLDPTIPDMDCSVDEIADYVSCYGSAIASKEEAERRFMGLIGELQAVLPSERWQGAETEPRIRSIRSYICRDQDSHAQIDIDIAPRWSPNEEISYVITIFGWTAIEPRL